MPKGSSLINEPNNHPYITVSNMNNNFEDLNTYQYVPTEIYSQIKNYIVDCDDLIISVAGTLGLVKKVPKCLDKANLTENANRISEIKIDIDYLQYYLNTKIIQNRILAVQTNNAQPKLALKEIRNFKINYPPIEEQKKVSKFLSLIDSKIQLLEKKHENYLNFKKYLMQQIFAQKLRFRNFNENFNEYLISQLFISKKGSGLSKDMIENDGVNKCVLYGELYTNYSEIISEVQSRTNEECKSLSKYGDILIPSSTTTKGIDLVTASVILDDDVYLGGDITILRNKDDSIVNNSYFAYYFSNGLIKDVSRLTQGSTIIHLYWKDFKKVKVMLPSLEEQEKITNILISIDEKLNEINNIIDSMKEFKKGLLQQMFV